jgi:TonB family protein
MIKMMNQIVLSGKMRLALAMLLASTMLAGNGFAKTVAPKASQTADSATAYVAAVFDKMQHHWEEQAYENRLTANSLLTFIVDEDGTLTASHVDANTAGQIAAQELVSFLKQNAPFGHFPSNLTGSQLEFKVKLTPGSLQMLGYQVVEHKVNEQVITYASPTTAQPTPLYYARAIPVTPGKVWDKPDTQTNDEKAMADYVNQVQEQIRKNWRLAEDYKFNRTVAMLMIDRNGSLLGAQLKQSSGDKTVDKAALNAIYTAGPFPKAPANVQSLPVMIEYIFDPVMTDAQ